MNYLRPGEEVHLAESYEMVVIVRSGDSAFSGRLTLTPEKITLAVSGDLNESRNYELDPTHIDALECESFNLKFLLLQLEGFYSHGHCLSGVRHFEVNYQVAFAFILPPNFDHRAIAEVNISSPTIDEWVGTTQPQHYLLANHGGSGEKSSLESALFAPIAGVGTMEVCYEVCNYYNQQTRSAGIKCSLYTNLSVDTLWPAEEVLDYLASFRSFFGMLHGDEPTITIVQLCEEDTAATPGYLYYPSASLSCRHPVRYSVFPLSKDLVDNTLGLPEFPVEAVSTFFNQDKAKQARWHKYVKYRQIGVLEDRYLGIFRLLEAFTLVKKPYLDPDLLKKTLVRVEKLAIHIFGKNNKSVVKSFLKRLLKVNESKYNTEVCIKKYLATIPEPVRSTWKFQAADIKSICDLRNNITHANDYYISEDDLLDRIYFVNTLLFFALLESIGVHKNITAKVIPRIEGYDRIRNPCNPRA